ncbi:Maff2 family protein, partial [Dysosmobacter welbionis]
FGTLWTRPTGSPSSSASQTWRPGTSSSASSTSIPERRPRHERTGTEI